MAPINTIYNNNKPVAIIRGENLKEKILEEFPNYLSKPTKDFSEINKNWFEIFQKGQLISYFSNIKYASLILYGEFKSDRIRE